MSARHTQGRDEHGNAAQQEHGSTEGEESPQQDNSVLVHDQDKHPDAKEERADQLANVKRPGYVRHIVQEDVGQRRISLHVRNPFVHHDHHKGSDPGDEESVPCGEKSNISLQFFQMGMCK